MTAPSRLGVLGGTFDPVHLGHLDALDAAQDALALSDVVVVPSSKPPHRTTAPKASGAHRLAMVQLAVEDRRGCRASDIELTREGPTYTIDTLETLHRQGWPPSQIFFIMGADALAEIATWRAYPEVLNAAHFVGIARPGAALDAVLGRAPILRTRLAPHADALPSPPDTSVLFIHARTRDISSTTVRARLRARQPIGDLVPRHVAEYIATHHLYEAVDDLHGKNDDGSTAFHA